MDTIQVLIDGVTAFGTVIAVGVALWVALHDRREREASQARLIFTPRTDAEDHRLVFKVKNASPSPIYDLEIVRVAIRSKPGGHDMFSASDMLERKRQVLEGGDSWTVSVGFGPRVTGEDLIEKWADIQYTFVDANGRRWQRTPSKPVPKPVRDRERALRRLANRTHDERRVSS